MWIEPHSLIQTMQESTLTSVHPFEIIGYIKGFVNEKKYTVNGVSVTVEYERD